jgi:hypothetical protein
MTSKSIIARRRLAMGHRARASIGAELTVVVSPETAGSLLAR